MGGTTGTRPMQRASSRMSLPSEALSIRRATRPQCGPISLIRRRPSGGSPVWPGVRLQAATLRSFAATKCSLVLQPLRLRLRAWGPIFLRASCIEVRTHDGRVKTDDFDARVHQALALEVLKDAVQHACAAPAHRARVDGVPVAIRQWKRTPLAAVGGHVQDGVEHLQIFNLHVTALARQPVFDLLKLLGGQLHECKCAGQTVHWQLVLTRPKTLYVRFLCPPWHKPL